MSRRGPVERRPRIGHVFLDALEYLWAERFCIECTARTIPSVANRAMIFVSTGLVGRTQVAPTGDYQTGMMANRQQDSKDFSASVSSWEGVKELGLSRTRQAPPFEQFGPLGLTVSVAVLEQFLSMSPVVGAVVL